MSLDLFASNIDDAVNYAARTSGAELPSTFSDNFNDAWNKGYLVNQSISGEIRKTTARSQMIDDAIAKTGDQSFGQSGEGGGFDTAAFNAKVAQHKATKPDLDLNPISDEAVQARADEIGVRQLADSAHMAGRERTTGGAIGSFLGTAAAALSDPVNLIAFPLAAPESLGVLGTALAWGAIGGGSQVAIEALNAPAMERIQPGYSTSGQPVTNVLESALGGAVLGGGIKGLSSAWSRVKTGEWPRTVRDAGNVVESEAQIANTNPLPGVDGEAAHRTALNKAIDDIANNRPVDVDGIVTPQQLAALDDRAVPVLAAKDAAQEAQLAVKAASDEALTSGKPQPELPFVQTAAQARVEASTADLTEGVQNIARLAGHEMPVEDAAKIASRIAEMNDPDKARALLDEVFVRPQTISDTLPVVEKPKAQTPKHQASQPALDEQLTPENIEKMRVDPDLADTVDRDLDKLMLERPGLEVPTGVTVDAEGKTVPTSRTVESVVAEADARLAAAKEIEACAGPLQTAERAA